MVDGPQLQGIDEFNRRVKKSDGSGCRRMSPNFPCRCTGIGQSTGLVPKEFRVRGTIYTDLQEISSGLFPVEPIAFV